MRGVTIISNTQGDGSKFQLTRLMRGVTDSDYKAGFFYGFQLTRLMRGVTFWAVDL